jgi:predicted TIM-barrel fold metal-dependent hydrolase
MAIHKPNIFFDLSGYAPKYFPEVFKKEIRSRLQDRVMFALDYPILPFARLFSEWEAEGYSAEILEKVYYKNAIRILDLELDEAKFA